MRALLGATLLVLGLAACAYGAIIWVAIPSSDTATGSLIAFGLTFAIPGLAAIAAAVWLLRRD